MLEIFLIPNSKMSRKEEVEKELNLLTKEKFSLMIEEKVEKGLTYIDAIVILTQENGIDSDKIKKLITNSIKIKIEEEAIELNYIKRQKEHKLI